MPNLIDLSIPLRHGDGRLGLEVALSTSYRFETCGWQGSSFSMFAHYATGADIYNIEYVHNLGRISAPRCAILALPMKLSGLDGAPARVVAVEGMDFPAEFTVSA